MITLLQFDRERIPERVVHARGASAKGFFEVSCLFPSCGSMPCDMIHIAKKISLSLHELRCFDCHVAPFMCEKPLLVQQSWGRSAALSGDAPIALQVTHDISHLTCADLMRAPGVQTPVIVRFSTVIHERGSPETLRDPRGFAVKFYTREGNWDLVGNNFPV